jgi:hypothetical protein
MIFFFNKEHILISRRYQLHSVSVTTHCPNVIIDAHSQSSHIIMLEQQILPYLHAIKNVIFLKNLNANIECPDVYVFF